METGATAVVGRGLVEILPDFRKWGSQLAADMRVARNQLDGSAAGLRRSAATVGTSMAKVGKGVTGIGIGVAAVSVKMAADFQSHTAVLQTAAGETTQGLKTVRAGILNIASGTGTGIQNLTDGMYTIEKAGFRGAGGLTVLKAAAQGAREENANLADVTNAMTSVMASYHLKTTDSVRVMNALKTSAGEGKITMEEFSGALSTVLPIASANKISFEEVGGAIATLTQHGTSAREATQELAATIRQLASPNNVAIREMQRFGLSSTDVSQNLGKRGLTGTLDLLTGTILKKMGPSGKILLSSFEGTKQSAKNAQLMLGKMPPEIQKVAKEYLGGKMSLEDWNSAMKGTPVGQQPMLRNFKTLVDRSKGFSRELKSGGPAAKTYTDALKKMSGGAIGLNTILQLTGESSAGFKDRVAKTGESFHNASKDVEGWKVTQQLLSVQLDRAKESVKVLAIEIGTKLIPVVSSIVGWLLQHKNVAMGLVGVLAGLAGVLMGAYVAQKLYAAVSAISTAAQWAWNAAVGVGRGLALGTRIQLGLLWAQQKIAAAGTAISTAAQWAWNAAVGTGSGLAIGTRLQLGLLWAQQKIAAAGTAISTAAQWAWNAAFETGRGLAIGTRIQIGLLWVQQKIAAAGTAIVTAAQWAWNAAMDANPIGLVVLAIGLLVAGIVWVATKTTWFQTAWKYTWNAVKVAAEWVGKAVQAVWSGLVGFLKSAWDTIYRNVISPIVRFFTVSIPNAAQHMKDAVNGLFRTLALFIIDRFGDIIHGAAKLFGWVPGVGGKLKQAEKQFQTFRDNVNKVMGGINGHQVSVPVSFRTVGGTKVFTRARGGPIDGVGTETSDSNLVLMSKGEHVWTAKEVRRAGGHQAVMGLRKAAKEGKLPAFAGGGTLDTRFTGIPSYKTVSSTMAKAVRAEIDANKRGLFNLLPQAMAASGYLGGGGAPSGGANAWRSVVLQMLSMVGQSAGLVNTVLRRMQQESGGNPNIVNKWDSNWKAGHPSVGLMQVIGPTFRAYAGRYLHTGPFLYGTSVNPQANIYASFRYALSRYGSLANAFNRAGGYALGTTGSTAGWHWVGEDGPELAKLPSGTRIRSSGASVRQAAAQAPVVHLTVHNHGVIGSRQEVENWLVETLDQLRRKNRLPRALGGAA